MLKLIGVAVTLSVVGFACTPETSMQVETTHRQTVEVLETQKAQDPRPNFVVIFVDDLGYGDLGCYGSPNIRTPHLDRMAAEGLRFTSFYAQTVCGPSRAALMTGSYPIRVARHQDNQEAVHPELHDQEITIAELLQSAGYATGCFGKWDLAGHNPSRFIPELMPNHQGFDTFWGTSGSNDRSVNLFHNETLIETEANMATLTRRYTDHAVTFIQAHGDQPFFVYVPHTMPHTRLAASAEFRGTSRRGLYGDVVEEIDAEVGRILRTLEEQGVTGNTYVIFASDNGPWFLRGHHGGSAGPLRGAKTSSWEGGVRVPCIVWAPGRVPAGRIYRDIATTMDLLPTLCALTGLDAPADRVLDGQDISGIWSGAISDGDLPPRDFYYYAHRRLQAVRSGPWKLHLTRPLPTEGDPFRVQHLGPYDAGPIESPLLFHLERDIGERHDVAERHPEVVRELIELAEVVKAELGHMETRGSGSRVFD